jgi:PAS domain S-box-containing protein
METTTGPESKTDALIDPTGAITGRLVRTLTDATHSNGTPGEGTDAQPHHDLLDALGVAVYTTDAAGVITYYNPAAAELWGRHPQIGKDVWCGSWKIYHLDGLTVMPHNECPMAICLKEDREVRGAEAIAERPDGSRVYFRPFPTPLHDESGKLVGAINVLVDVTDARLAEFDALRLAAIVESSDDAIASKDLNGIVASWNPAAERIFGYTAEEMIGQSIRRIIPPDRQGEEDEVLARIRKGERVDHFQTIRRKKDGTEFPIALTVSPVKDRTGRIIGASKIARDITEREIAEKALRESEERLRLAQSIARVGTFEWNIQTGVNVWTPDLEAIYGLRPGEFSGTQLAWESLIHPEDRAFALEKVDEAIRSGLPAEHEWRVVWPDGSIHWVAARFQCMKDANGQPLLLSGVNIDITERKLAEQALFESESRLTIAMAAGQMGSWEWDVAANAVTWSEALEHIHGLEPGTFPGTFEAFLSDVHPDDRDDLQARIAKSLETGTHEIEYRIIRPDAQLRWVLGKGQLVRDAKGNPSRMVGVCMDITERKQAEQALIASEMSLRDERDNLETINRIGTLLSAQLDLDKLVQSLTDEATRLVGADFGAFFYNVSDAKGESYMLYTASGVPREKFEKFPMPRNTAIFAPTFAGEGIVRLDDVRKDPRYGKNAPYNGMPRGHLPVVSYLAVPVTSRPGEVLGGLFFGHSQPGMFTERHEKILEGIAAQTAIALENARLFERLQKSMATKDEFLGLVSHELRTPITTILGNGLLLQRRADRLPEDSKQQALRDVVIEAERLQEIIENLLTLTRMDTTEHVECEPVRLQPLISEAVEVFRRRGMRREIAIDFGHDVPIVMGQPAFVSLVLENLVSNADKYSPGDDPIEIFVLADDQQVAVTVRDHGIGLDEEDVSEVFTPFYRSPRVKNQAKGIGLGLAVCKRVTEAQGGTIRAIARPEGGCDFVLTLNRYQSKGDDDR